MVPRLPNRDYTRSGVAVSFRYSSISRVERVASVVAAVAVTVLAGFVMMLAPGRGLLTAIGPGHTPAPLPDRIVYVTPPPLAPRTSVDRPRIRETSAPARPTGRTPAAAGAGVVEPNVAPIDTASPAPESVRVQPSMSPVVPVAPPPRPAGAPAAGAAVGFTRASEPLKFDSAISAVNKRFAEGVTTGLLRPPPPTQDEIDAKLRAEAVAGIVARGAGAPAPRVMTGTSVPVGLPGGGPSNKQRARDRAIFAELQQAVALRQQRAESIATVRTRRADSLAQLADSGRRRPNQNY